MPADDRVAGDATERAREQDSMWNTRTLAECLLSTPLDAPVNVGLARDLARAALDTADSVAPVPGADEAPECTCGYDPSPTQHRLFCPWRKWYMTRVLNARRESGATESPSVPRTEGRATESRKCCGRLILREPMCDDCPHRVAGTRVGAVVASLRDALEPLANCVAAFDCVTLNDTEFGRLRERLWPLLVAARVAAREALARTEGRATDEVESEARSGEAGSAWTATTDSEGVAGPRPAIGARGEANSERSQPSGQDRAGIASPESPAQIVASQTVRLAALTVKLAEAEARVVALTAEVARLEQGLWDCAIRTGFDNDGDETSASLSFPDIVTLALREVERLRADYDAAVLAVRDEPTTTDGREGVGGVT